MRNYAITYLLLPEPLAQILEAIVGQNGHDYAFVQLTGNLDGELAMTIPLTITQDVLERGQERYTIFCSPSKTVFRTKETTNFAETESLYLYVIE